MIYHILRIGWREGMSEADYEAAQAEFARLGALESVAHHVVGRDIGDPADGYTYSVCYAIPDLDAYARYCRDIRPGEGVVVPFIARLSAFDITDEADPEVGEKIRALHRARFDDEASLKDLVRDADSLSTFIS